VFKQIISFQKLLKMF